MSDGIENARFSGLVVEGNCDNSSGSCSDIKCYGTETECDIDYDANKE